MDDVLADRVRKKARRLVVWVLAHRLEMEASTLSRKAVNAPDSEKFKRLGGGDLPNPVRAFIAS